MAPHLVGDLRSLLALAALLLLPGLLVVRAPWTAVPFLSASFWIVSWGWLPAPGRQRFLLWALGSFALLALMRLAKPSEATRPGWPARIVAGAALLRLTPLALWPVAPGAEASFHTMCAVLMSWKDGLPSTYEPLFPLPAFGAGGIGLPALAADVALLGGAGEPRALLLAGLAAHALLQVALYALLARLCAAPVAALASLLALGLLVPHDLLGTGGSAGSLALALLVAAAALLVRGSGRSPAVAAGLFLAAALETQPALAPLALLTLPLAGAVAQRAPGGDGRAVADRLGTAILAAVVGAAPLLRRLDFARSPQWTPLALALAAVALAAALARLLASLLRRGPASAALAVALLLALGAERARRDYATAGAAVLVSDDDLDAMAWLREHTRPTDVVCNDPHTAGIWVPALAGRAVTAPELPPASVAGLPPAVGAHACAFTYVSKGAAPPGPRPGAAVFRNASVSILQNP